jgi:hypothetical protein
LTDSSNNTEPTQTTSSKPAEKRSERRKIVIKKIDSISSPALTPSTDILLHDAKCIIASELNKYKRKTQRDTMLDLKEARVVQGYLDALTKLQREEREQSRSEDLSSLSDDELLQLASQALKATRPRIASGEGEK